LRKVPARKQGARENRADETEEANPPGGGAYVFSRRREGKSVGIKPRKKSSNEKITGIGHCPSSQPWTKKDEVR